MPTSNALPVLRHAVRAAVLLGLCGVAAAQVVVTPPASRRGGDKEASPAPRPEARSRTRAVVVAAPSAQGAVGADARASGLRDSGNAAVNPRLPAAYALSGFALKFENGDHKLRRIGVIGKDQFTEFALADSNGDDPFNGQARYRFLPAGRTVSKSAYGGGTFEIPLLASPDAASKTLVLSGFEFRRADGSDANLRAIGVWLDARKKVARVTLMDDQGADFRGFEDTVGAAFLAGMLPFGIFAGSTAGIGEAVMRLDRAGGEHRPYAVTVQYTWIPDVLVETTGALSGGTLANGQPSRGAGRAPSRIDALQGFEFLFTNSDHHLLGLGVNAIGSGDALFQDGNGHDPMQWTASYVTLRNPGVAAPAREGTRP